MTKTGKRRSNTRKSSRQWRRMDLHLHTPASNDYEEANIDYLDILRQADARGLDIIAFTDHNTASGYAAMMHEIGELELLEKLKRLKVDEEQRLAHYRRLLTKILVLPGFEFTATFGFHILGIFSPETPVSYLEHLLLTLNVPIDRLQAGSSTVGATSDVLTAYRLINQAGGLVIAAHANSGNGVAMRGLDFGGQTRIAYTQDPNLHCLEVTDLEKRSRYSTRRFFDGSKPEYPRPMRCIQGSDAHRLTKEAPNSKNLGVGDRVTEILLDNVSFETLAMVLKGNDFSLTRPYRGPASPLDFVLLAREEGPSIVQSFHASVTQRGGYLNRVLEDICAMANTNGGTIYIGLTSKPEERIVGVRDPKKTIDYLNDAVTSHLTPDPNVTIDSLSSQGQNIMRITVPPGQDLPYAMDDNRFYVRDDTETTLAVRDEIVRLVERRLGYDLRTIVDTGQMPELEVSDQLLVNGLQKTEKEKQVQSEAVIPPRTGVEIVDSEDRNGTFYHTVRDLRNGNLIKNVTKSSARKLWHYAITQVESGHPKIDEIEWHGNKALLNQRSRDSYTWYDLAMRDTEGIHIYYGVTDGGLNDEWMTFIQQHPLS